MADCDELLAELDLALPEVRGLRDRPLGVRVVRALTPQDMPIFDNPLSSEAPLLKTITTQHHRLAQLVAQGKDSVEVSLLTGYCVQYVRQLGRDPAFAELVAAYSAERRQVFVDVLERMRALGLATLDELQQRLAEEPKRWSQRELMELADLLLVKGAEQKRGVSVNGPTGVNINLNFVEPTIAGARVGVVIDGERAA